MSTKNKIGIKKENWKLEQIAMLLEEVDKRKEVLFGKLSAFVSNERKKAQWQSVATAVNAVSSTERTVEETIKKWRDLKSKTKAKDAERRKELRKTGGGELSAGDLSSIDVKVLSIVGPVCVRGIPKGLDSGTTEPGTVEDIEGEDSSQSRSIKRPIIEADCIAPGAPIDGSSDSGENENVPKRREKKRKTKTTLQVSERLIEIEKERLQVEKDRLAVERERLCVEKSRLEIEKERLKLKKQNNSTVCGRSAVDNAACTYFNLH